RVKLVTGVQTCALPIFEERFETESLAVWLERLDESGVPAAPVHDIAEVAEHPQTRALGLLQPLPHATIGDLVTLAPPLSLDGERLRHRAPPPLLGADSAEVLAEAGYSEAEIAELAAAGIARLAAQ